MKKIIQIISFLISFSGFAFFLRHAKAIIPAEYFGFPLGIDPVMVYCNCVNDAVCECPQEPTLQNNLIIDVVFWLFFAFVISLLVGFVFNYFKKKSGSHPIVK